MIDIDQSRQGSSVLAGITDRLVSSIEGIAFGPPVAFAYNPLVYARQSWDLYCARFGLSPRKVLLVGLNPGPFGMAQVGVPFGEISAVRDWMGIVAPVGRPRAEHPARPILGFQCTRSEVSGRRLWGWAMDGWTTADRFFETFFVTNYCPLVFMESSGRNLTPDKLPSSVRNALFSACDIAIRDTVTHFKPEFVMGMGTVTATRLREALDGMNVRIGQVPHPSPANPAANRGWGELMDRSMAQIGISRPRG
ncbi:MAG TPA: single-stranded DNA-binding protein [Myxococcota bacterium]|nr:single-stranded DNA-binding protein [Myxococcota bacterium]HPV03941.1 single-stranded DNA-binding protein [Myxococcota bacterium]